MAELVSAEGIEFHAVNRGALYLYRDPRELEAGVRKMALLAEHGQRQEVLDPGQVARLEPAFEPVRNKIAGAVRDVGDSSGDSRLFTESLARICRDKLGVTVRLGVRVTALRAEGGSRHGRRDQRRHVHGRRLRPRPRRRHDAPRAHDRGPARDLPRQGLLLDVPRPGGRPRADPPGRRRAVARGLVPAGRPPPAHLDGRVRRLRPEPHPSRFQQHPPARAGSLPRPPPTGSGGSSARASGR